MRRAYYSSSIGHFLETSPNEILGSFHVLDMSTLGTSPNCWPEPFMPVPWLLMPNNNQRLWTREELIIAFNLYCKIPFGQIDQSNPAIIALAGVLDRTPAALSWKLANFARLDPALQARGIKGASHGSRGEVEIWEEFNTNWDSLAFESERLLANLTHRSVEEMNGLNEDELPKEGLERERFVRVRVNQRFFRSTVLTSYGSRCCITGLAIPSLLTASHIAPWAKDPNNRMNPRNGLCLNLLHHKAFDEGLITITPEFRVRVSSSLAQTTASDANNTFFAQYDNQLAQLPRRFLPDTVLLEWHNKTIFVR